MRKRRARDATWVFATLPTLSQIASERTESLSASTPTVMVPVTDAMTYARDLVAGFENLLIELGRNLANGLPRDLTEQQRRAICRHIDEQIAAAREAVGESVG